MRLSGQVPRLAVGSGGMPGGGKAAVAFRHPHGAAIRGIGFQPKRAMPAPVNPRCHRRRRASRR